MRVIVVLDTVQADLDCGRWYSAPSLLMGKGHGVFASYVDHTSNLVPLGLRMGPR